MPQTWHRPQILRSRRKRRNARALAGAQPERPRRRNPLPVHCYAAKFGDDLAFRILRSRLRRGQTVLDPFSGTGTTIVQAARLGINGIGIDVDPIACLISRVQTRRYSDKWLSSFQSKTRSAVMHIEQSLRRHKKVPRDALLFNVNGFRGSIPERPEVQFWFSHRQRIVLASLIAYMRSLKDLKERELFALCISASIIRKWPSTISRAMDIDHSRPHRVRPHLDSYLRYFRLFSRVVSLTSKSLSDSRPCGSRGWFRIVRGDCVPVMRGLRNRSVDCVLTSPPYLNAINYPRAHKFAEWWLFPSGSICQPKNYVGLRQKNGPVTSPSVAKILERRGIRLEQIGKIDPPLARQMTAYFEDMFDFASACKKLLKTRQPAIIVLADNTSGGKKIPVVRIVCDLMREVGFKRVHTASRPIRISRRRYPLAFKGVMRTEAVITAWN